MFTAESKEIKMNYVKFGTGKKIFVMLPGVSIKSVMLSESAIAQAYSAFSEEYTVYLFDRKSEMPCDYSVKNMADDTSEIMKYLGLRNACVFGASQGGMIALCLAVYHPELVKCLVLGSAASHFSCNSKISGLIYSNDGDIEKYLKSVVNLMYSENTVSAYGESVVSSMLPVTDDELSRFEICVRAALQFDISDEIEKITCPVLAIASEGDKMIDPSESAFIADRTKGELFMYDKTYGHAVYDEAPDYKDRIKEFFDRY